MSDRIPLWRIDKIIIAIWSVLRNSSRRTGLYIQQIDSEEVRE